MERRIFSARLLEKLAKMRNSRLSVLEAPAGYGKTTAVSHALEGVETVRWYTGVEHLPDTSFYWFIQQLGNEDERTFRRMESISFLNRSNAAQAARILGDVRVERPVTLVFDNFQFAADNWPPQVIDALAKRAEDGLHLIFIAQNLGRLRPVFEAQEGGVCFLREKDLLLTQEDICGLARQGGMSLTRQQAKEVIRGTGGWPAAVSLSLAADGEVGEMDELLYRLFWVRSEERQQTALLRLSLFDCITPAMVDALLPAGELSRGEREELFRRTPLVRHDAMRDVYYPHELLLRFLAGRLQAAEETLQRDIYDRAGGGTGTAA